MKRRISSDSTISIRFVDDFKFPFLGRVPSRVETLNPASITYGFHFGIFEDRVQSWLQMSYEAGAWIQIGFARRGVFENGAVVLR